MTTRPQEFRKGRGAVSNVEARFDALSREADDAALASLEELHGTPATVRTTVEMENARTIISRNQSPDIPFDQSINAYRGCEHGCSYCFARPTHAYLGLSPGLDFETRLFAKPNAPELLARELRKRNYTPSVIALGTNTDPYQPIERKLLITRGILETLEAFDHPVAITTKGALVTRDIDILSRMAAKGLARVFLSVTTLDPELSRKLEPRASSPTSRLEGIRKLAEAGIPTGVLVAPVIPALTDYDLEQILKRAAEAGATSAAHIMIRLPLEVRDIFIEWLDQHYPGRKDHVLSIIRSMRDGKLNNTEFGERMRGSGIHADMIGQRFRLACQRLGLNRERPALRTDLFRRPPEPGPQGSLF